MVRSQSQLGVISLEPRADIMDDRLAQQLGLSTERRILHGPLNHMMSGLNQLAVIFLEAFAHVLKKRIAESFGRILDERSHPRKHDLQRLGRRVLTDFQSRDKALDYLLGKLHSGRDS
jgi:hypothetical protein